MSRIKQDLQAYHTGLDGAAPTPDEEARSGSKSLEEIHVGIVGAGFAGLRCADVLLQHGIKVSIVEARDRLGGRIGQSNHLGHLVDLSVHRSRSMMAKTADFLTEAQIGFTGRMIILS